MKDVTVHSSSRWHMKEKSSRLPKMQLRFHVHAAAVIKKTTVRIEGRKIRPPRLDTERQWLTHSTPALKSYPPLWSTSSFSVLSASLFSFTTHLLGLRTGYKAFAGPVADLPFPFALCTAGIFYLTRQASAVTEQQKAALKEKGMYDCQLSLNFSV
jgi:hypothetical protein